MLAKYTVPRYSPDSELFGGQSSPPFKQLHAVLCQNKNYFSKYFRGGHWGLRYCGVGFSCGISVILILNCGIAVISKSAGCCFFAFWTG